VVEQAIERELAVELPARLLELIGVGPNQWTAAEGALKIRETSRIATEGLSVEQFFHGPSVAIDDRDVLVCLDGGGPGVERLRAVAEAAEACGARVHVLSETSLPEPLSVFPLTVYVQRIRPGAGRAGRRRPGRLRLRRPGPAGGLDGADAVGATSP
jgi:glutamine---fructose-6-phosphate transaminase (isomerizing)